MKLEIQKKKVNVKGKVKLYMDIFLFRHFESIKNTQETFSSMNDKEELTGNGILYGKKVAADLRKIVELKGLNIKRIYCANSVRATESAKLVAAEFSKDIEIVRFDEFLSTKSEDVMGKTKEDARKINPLFIQELCLYDAGIFNAYDFHRKVGKKEKQEYEKKVFQCIEKIINNDEKEDVKIICLHNSSITAAIINFARKQYHYPIDFYGKVIADNGKIFWISDKKQRLNIYVANCESNLLLKIIEEKAYES